MPCHTEAICSPIDKKIVGAARRVPRASEKEYFGMLRTTPKL